MDKRSYPVAVVFDAETQELLRRVGLQPADVKAVRLLSEHFQAIDRILAFHRLPGGNRSDAIRLAIQRYAEGRHLRYDRYTDFVRDALLWYSSEVGTASIPFLVGGG